MDPLKSCSLCGTTSNETAVFNCAYAKGDLEVCLECLTEGIMEITKAQKIIKPSVKKPSEEQLPEFIFEDFEMTVPEEVFGFNCEGCKTVLFSQSFPVTCECGFLNNDIVIKKQDLLSWRK
jgi:hypothetical protein